MNLIKIIKLLSLIIILLSCSNRNNGDNINPENIVENIVENNYFHTFYQQNIHKVEMMHPLEYYKNEIIKYEDNYYGFDDISMKITDLMNISSIVQIVALTLNLPKFNKAYKVV